MTKTTEQVLTLVDDGGHEYTGTPEQIVERMYNLSFAPAANEAMWMRMFADRAFTQTGVDVDPSSPESFIEGLMEAGLLKPKKG